jgi:Uma2 family endonuclease
MATTDTAKWTYDDLVLIGDDGRQHEIIDGEHYANPAPNIRHQTIAGNLHVAMFNWLDTHPIGRVWVAPVDVVFSDFDVVEPDIVYVSNDRAEVVRRENIKGAPDLVVEVLSFSNRRKDEVTKRKLYETRGVEEYWIVDPEIDVIKVYRGGIRAAELSLENDDTLTTPLLPGLEIRLKKVFG